MGCQGVLLQLANGLAAIGLTASLCGHSEDFALSLPVSRLVVPIYHLYCLENSPKVHAGETSVFLGRVFSSFLRPVESGQPPEPGSQGIR